MNQDADKYRTIPGVITKQPTAQDPPPIMHNVWMARPPPIAHCPPGLEYLLPLQQLHVIQKQICLTCSKYEFSVMNSGGQHVYYIEESTRCLSRWGCCTARWMDLRVLDVRDNEVIHLEMPCPCRCDCSLESCCYPYMYVSAPPGRPIGEVRQLAFCTCSRFYTITDTTGEAVLTIQAPYWMGWGTRAVMDLDLPIEAANGMRIGSITKKYGGYERERIFMGYYFVITFPVDLDVQMKALLLGASIFFGRKLFQMVRNQEETIRNQCALELCCLGMRRF